MTVVARVAGLQDERRLEIVVRHRGIKREKDSDSIAKLCAISEFRTHFTISCATVLHTAVE